MREAQALTVLVGALLVGGLCARAERAKHEAREAVLTKLTWDTFRECYGPDGYAKKYLKAVGAEAAARKGGYDAGYDDAKAGRCHLDDIPPPARARKCQCGPGGGCPCGWENVNAEYARLTGKQKFWLKLPVCGPELGLKMRAFLGCRCGKGCPCATPSRMPPAADKARGGK